MNPPQPPPLASTFWSTSAGNSSLVLPFDPVLEDPVAVEHHTLVAGEDNDAKAVSLVNDARGW